MNIQPTNEQLIHKIIYDTDQENSDNTINAAVKIAQIAFDSSVEGWLEDILPSIIRQYVIGIFEKTETTDPKEIAKLAIKKIKADAIEQLTDSLNQFS